MTMITRIGYCEKCAKLGRPLNNENFLVFGGTSKGFKVFTAYKNGRSGFTPHLFELKRVNGDTIAVKSLCCMNNCGVIIENKDDKYFFAYVPGAWKSVTMDLRDWNALVMFKKTGYEI